MAETSEQVVAVSGHQIGRYFSVWKTEWNISFYLNGLISFWYEGEVLSKEQYLI